MSIASTVHQFYVPSRRTLRVHLQTRIPLPRPNFSVRYSIPKVLLKHRHRSAGRNYEKVPSDEEDDEEEDDAADQYASLDLLVKLSQNMFKKVSKRANKAARGVLPPSISNSLVEFAVNGVLILAFVWVLKALLEVICALGSAVYVSVLLTRVVWSIISYMQDAKYRKKNGYEEDQGAWVGA